MAQDDANTSCSARDPLEVARSIIDRDIARLEESIRALKSRRNELSPISRLPAEILCTIFSLTEDKSLPFLSRTRKPESWTNFSQVSRQWRTSALSAPEIWTRIPLNYPRWAQEMLLRSKMAKLTIRSGLSLDTSNPKIFETVRSCLSEMNRVEELKLIAIPGVILKEIFQDLPKSAPHLHTLGIGSYSFSHAGPSFPIHEDFLYDTDRLQRVELTNCEISWDSRLLTGLTVLTLDDCSKANSSIIQVLHALQRMPALTDLHLKDSIPDGSDGPSTFPVVDLPCLRVLRISSGLGPLTTVLRHITFPHTVKFNLTCKESRSTQIDFSNFLSVMSTKFFSSLVIRSLSLRVPDDTIDTGIYGLEFYFWTTVIQDDFPSPSCLSSYSHSQLILTWPESHHHEHGKVLTSAFGAMRLQFLSQLQISTNNYIDSQTWVKTFGKLPVLKWVCVRDYEPDSFLEALVYKTKAAETSKTAYSNVSFPKLCYIHLECTNFSSTGSCEKLLDCLMERYERKAEVQVLRLVDCYYITSIQVKSLKEIVVDVIWDEIERGYSDEDMDYDEDGDYDIDGTVDDYDDFSSFEEAPVDHLVPSASISASGSVRSSDELIAARYPSSSEDVISSSTAAGTSYLLSRSPPSDDHPENDDEEDSDGSLDAAIAGAIARRIPQVPDNLRGSSMVPEGPYTAADFDWLPEEWFE